MRLWSYEEDVKASESKGKKESAVMPFLCAEDLWSSQYKSKLDVHGETCFATKPIGLCKAEPPGTCAPSSSLAASRSHIDIPPSAPPVIALDRVVSPQLV